MNREQRRHPPKDGAPTEETRPPDVPTHEMISDARPPDTLDPRAKNQGHGKKTADKWNQ